MEQLLDLCIKNFPIMAIIIIAFLIRKYIIDYIRKIEIETEKRHLESIEKVREETENKINKAHKDNLNAVRDSFAMQANILNSKLSKSEEEIKRLKLDNESIKEKIKETKLEYEEKRNEDRELYNNTINKQNEVFTKAVEAFNEAIRQYGDTSIKQYGETADAISKIETDIEKIKKIY